MKQKKRGILWLAALALVMVMAVLTVGKATEFAYTTAYPLKYSEYVERYAEKYDVDQNLVYAVIRNESSFNPNAVSSVDARGLMQLMEDTFNWAKSRMEEPSDATYADVFDPEVNIQYGTYVLKLLLDEFDSEETAVAAYHAGWGNVKNWLEQPEHSAGTVDVEKIPFDNTKTYVKRVIKTKDMYEQLYH